MKFVFSADWHLSSMTPASRIDNYPETLLGKVEFMLQVCNELDAPLLLGGDLFHTPTQIDFIKTRFKKLVEKYKVKVYSVMGNHDLLYYDPGMVDRTSLGVLDGASLKLVDGTFVKFGDWKVYGHKFGDHKLPEVADEKSIILSHTYTDSKYSTDKLYLDPKEIKKSKASFLCVGHDHNLYEPKQVDGTWLVRSGALSRGTSNTENRVRVVSYAVLDTDTKTVEYRPITVVNKFEEVFKEKYDVERERVEVTFDDIQQFIDELKKNKIELNPYDILAGMGVSQPIYDRCAQRLNDVGLIKQN